MPSSKHASAASRFVDLPGGFHVHYRDEGATGAPLLVLLHGYGDSFTSWEGWVLALAPKFRIISLDFPGHALTRAPRKHAARRRIAGGFCGRSSQRSCNCPNSRGRQFHGRRCSLAIGSAASEPGQRADIGGCGGLRQRQPPGEVALASRFLRYRAGRAVLRNIDNRPSIREGLKADVYDKALISDFVVQRWADFQRAPGHRAILMNLNIAAHGQAAPQLLATISVPTLILGGAADPLLEPASAQNAAAIPGSRVIIYPKVGHLPQIEIALRSAHDAAGFLALAGAP